MTKYTVWFCGIEVESDTPQHAVFKALDQCKEEHAMMVDEVVEPSGIICMSNDPKRIGTTWKYGK